MPRSTIIILMALLALTIHQSAPAAPPAPVQTVPPSALSEKERLVLLGKIVDRYTVECGDGVPIPLENCEKWLAAGATPAERESREKLMSSVIKHAELIAALMMVTDPEIHQATRTPREHLYQSIITHATACDIKLTREDIATAPSADAYLRELESTVHKEIRRLATEASAPQETFDQLAGLIIGGILGSWSTAEFGALRDTLAE